MKTIHKPFKPTPMWHELETPDEVWAIVRSPLCVSVVREYPYGETPVVEIILVGESAPFIAMGDDLVAVSLAAVTERRG